MQKPQIILIPQNLLSEQSRNYLKQRMVLPSSQIPAPQIQIQASRPVAAVVGSKRPLPALSPEMKPLLKRPYTPPEPLRPLTPPELLLKEEEQEQASARKRANLDHLTADERMMRRKLKNRVAAQTARDKKKQYIDELEAELEQVRAERSRLQAENTDLRQQNTDLRQRNLELETRLGHVQSPSLLSFPPSPVSLPPSSPASLSLTSPVPPASALTPPEPAAGVGRRGGGAEGPCVVVQRLDDRVHRSHPADAGLGHLGPLPQHLPTTPLLPPLPDLPNLPNLPALPEDVVCTPAATEEALYLVGSEEPEQVMEPGAAPAAAGAATGVAASRVAALQLDIEQFDDSCLEPEFDHALLATSSTEQLLTTPSTEELLQELWLEAGLQEDWAGQGQEEWAGNLFPDLV